MPSKSKQQPDNEEPRKAPKAKKRARVKPTDEAIAQAEKAWDLPPGCTQDQVERDVYRYHIFEFDDVAYYLNPYAEVKKARVLSNFVCKVHMHIVDEQATRLITIRNEYKEEATLHIPHDAMNSLEGFRRVVTSQGNYQWKGSAAEYTRYLFMMMDRMGTGRMILEPGMQPEGFFAFSNKVLAGDQVIDLDRYGCFDLEDRRYYIPSANTTNVNSDAEYSNARKVRFISSPVTFEELSRQMLDVHRQFSMVAQVHAVGTVFSDYIRERVGCYPVPFYYGPPGTGKDEIIRGGQRFYGEPQRPVRLPAGNTSPGLVNVFAELRCIPMYATEWSSRLKDHMHEFCMGLYDGEGRRRGERIQAGRSRYATEDIPVRCTASMSGNEYPNLLDQLLDRLVVMEMPKLILDMDARQRFRTLKDMEDQGYSHLLAEVIRYRDDFRRDWMQVHYQRASEMTKIALGDRFISERMRKSVVLILSIYLFFQGRLPWAFTADQLLTWLTSCMLQQQSRRLSGDEVSSFWTAFIAAVNAGALVADKHFRVDQRMGLVAMYWSEIYPHYMEYHRRIFGVTGRRDIVSKLTMHEAFVPGKGGKLVHDAYRIGDRKSTAYVFDAHRTGVDLLGLLGYETAEAEATEKQPATDDLPF